MASCTDDPTDDRHSCRRQLHAGKFALAKNRNGRRLPGMHLGCVRCARCLRPCCKSCAPSALTLSCSACLPRRSPHSSAGGSRSSSCGPLTRAAAPAPAPPASHMLRLSAVRCRAAKLVSGFAMPQVRVVTSAALPHGHLARRGSHIPPGGMNDWPQRETGCCREWCVLMTIKTGCPTRQVPCRKRTTGRFQVWTPRLQIYRIWSCRTTRCSVSNGEFARPSSIQRSESASANGICKTKHCQRRSHVSGSHALRLLKFRMRELSLSDRSDLFMARNAQMEAGKQPGGLLCWMLDAGCWMLDVGASESSASRHRVS